MDGIAILTILAYGSLALELLVFPIPSEASTYQLFFRPAAATAGDALATAGRRPVASKALLFLVPTTLGVILFLIPLVAAFWRDLIGFLGPLPALHSPVVLLAGAALVVAGRVTTFASVLQLRRRRAGGALQPSGLFALSRNPGLVGMYAFYLGNCLLFPCLVLFVGLVPYVGNMHARVRMEESHLAQCLGPEYRDYLRRVPRYLWF